jgi:hypothetical protein
MFHKCSGKQTATLSELNKTSNLESWSLRHTRPWTIITKWTFPKGQRQLLRHSQRLSPWKMDCSPVLTLSTPHPSLATWDHPSLNSRSSACHLLSFMNWERIINKNTELLKQGVLSATNNAEERKHLSKSATKCFSKWGQKCVKTLS